MKEITRREDFKSSLKIGIELGEELLLSTATEYGIPCGSNPYPTDPTENYKYDVWIDDFLFEVKFDARSSIYHPYYTGNYIIEFETRNHKPSGITTTLSNYWCIANSEGLTIIRVEDLRDLIESHSYKQIPGTGRYGLDDNWCYLIPREDIYPLSFDFVGFLDRGLNLE
jgi:hypothetical protein